ncbi:polysaccharide deacetylase family protein [Brochothrix campestris]|uniref:NodB homology domain-containing protein n=1 Tax=Brochothrix campestris FSL F6-1037 TaxID=1265861 RepID=W7CQ74_9LIST|nr:polysaccharide deacetylase family protein [Brochothrix campestris]EUJ39247.1 Hypothetical protein YxkH [Brochothrix campestris FSL F6-1037]
MTKIAKWLLLIGLCVVAAMGTDAYLSQKTEIKPVKQVQKAPKKAVPPPGKAEETQRWLTRETPVKIPILMYHSISSGNSLRVPPTEFEQQMQFLKEAGYYTLTPAELYQAFETNTVPAEKVVLITFDDGYTDNYTAALPVLERYGLASTVFMITGTTGKPNHLTIEQMKAMQQQQVTIESHTVNHQELNLLAKETQLTEMIDSKRFIKDELDYDSIILSYPVGRYNDETLAAANTAGYKLAVTTEPGLASKADGYYQLKRVRITPGLSIEGYRTLIENGL